MISRAPLRDEVCRQILDRIHRGDLPPGSRVRDSDLASQLGVSRTPIREALLHLARDGVLETAMGRGFRVRPIDAAELREVGDILGALESLALRLSPPASAGPARPPPPGGPAARADPRGRLPLPRPRGRVAPDPARGLPQSPAARPDRLAPPRAPPLSRGLHARRRPPQPLHPATPEDPAGARGAWMRQRRGSVRAAVATRRRRARSVGRPGSQTGRTA